VTNNTVLLYRSGNSLRAYKQYGKEVEKFTLHTGDAKVDSILELHMGKQGNN